jgi:hypothetical protein
MKCRSTSLPRSSSTVNSRMKERTTGGWRRSFLLWRIRQKDVERGDIKAKVKDKMATIAARDQGRVKTIKRSKEHPAVLNVSRILGHPNSLVPLSCFTFQ